jgi:hypothetical protein
MRRSLSLDGERERKVLLQQDSACETDTPWGKKDDEEEVGALQYVAS